jgi:glycosyltransferase involved in cell wall biosynthesis
MDELTRIAAIGADPALARLIRRVAVTDQRRFDLIHICGPGPAPELTSARGEGVPLVASFPPALDGSIYRDSSVVLSPGPPADRALERAGVSAARIVRWEPGAELAGRLPARRGGSSCTIHAPGPLSGRDAALFGEALSIARQRHPQLELLADDVAEPADLFVAADTADAFGLPILEAQARGLAVIAVESVWAAELIESGRSGCLVPADADALAAAIRGLARRPTLRARLAAGGLLAAAGRPLERSLRQLADGYALALGVVGSPAVESRAA